MLTEKNQHKNLRYKSNFSIKIYETIRGFQVEPSTKLYPAVFVEPTVKEVLQFELGRIKVEMNFNKKIECLVFFGVIELFTINCGFISKFKS